MSLDIVNDLNWLAVIVATIAYFALAGAWFADPLFGRAWRRSIGWEQEPGSRLGAIYYAGPLVTCLVAVIAVAMLAEATGSDTLGEGLVLGMVLVVGLAGTVLFVTGVLDPKKPHPVTWFGITAGYHALGLAMTSMITAVWT